MVCLFSVWAVVLLVLKCLGRRQVGFMSGAPFTQYDAPSLVKSVRYTFAASAFMVLLFSILLVSKGTTQLQTAAETFDDSNQEVASISSSLAELSKALQTEAQAAIGLRDDLVSFLRQDVCPNQPGTNIEATLRDLSRSTLVAVQDLENFVQSDLQRLDTVLDDVQNAAKEIDTAFEESTPTPFQMGSIVIPYVVTTVFMIVALVLGWRETRNDKYLCFIHWFVLPLFIIFIAAAVIGCAVAAFIAQANADVCSGGDTSTPEGTVEAIMETEFTRTDFEFEVISFYLNQCREQNPLTFLDDYIQELNVAKQSLSDFVADIQSQTVAVISAECGVDFNEPFNLIQPLEAIVDSLLTKANEGIGLIGCRKIVPIYRHVMHDGTCTSAIQAESWIYSSLVTIAFFGMVMIMLRAAYQPLAESNRSSDKGAGELAYADDKSLSGSQLSGSQRSGTHSSIFGSTNQKSSIPDETASWDENFRKTQSTDTSFVSADPTGQEFEIQTMPSR